MLVKGSKNWWVTYITSTILGIILAILIYTSIHNLLNLPELKESLNLTLIGIVFIAVSELPIFKNCSYTNKQDTNNNNTNPISG